VVKQFNPEVLIDCGPASSDPFQRFDHYAEVRDAVFAEVPDVVLADAEDAGEIGRGHEDGEDQQPQGGVLGAQPFRGLQTIVIVTVRPDAAQANVHHGSLGPVPSHHGDQLIAAGRFGDDVHPGGNKRLAVVRAEPGRIVGDDHTHGIVIVSVVPLPGGLSMSSTPP
jgi:hypothetical protein